MISPREWRQRQAEYFDSEVDVDFEVHRPHRQPRLYRYLIDYKFNTVTRLLGEQLYGKRVVAICCGSGMDAEYLVRAGARVVGLDVSGGCLQRARERSMHYGVSYDLVCGDAETLPFLTASFDYGFVHDGLHHLANPLRAVTELARVARRGVLITEPADAILTRLLVWLRFSTDEEEAGNNVVRFRPEDLSEHCKMLGLSKTRWTRYLMRYGHPPGDWWRMFDHPAVQRGARAALWLLATRPLSCWGNKLAFVATRSHASIMSTSSRP